MKYGKWTLIGMLFVSLLTAYSLLPTVLERNRAGMGGTAEGEIVKPPPRPSAPQAAYLSSTWEWEHYRGGELLDAWREKNVVTQEGLTALMGVMFKSWAAVSPWRIMIYESNSTPSGNSTYAVKGVTECVAYDEGTRPVWTVSGTTSMLTNSASKASFTINATKTIYGAALVSSGVSNDSTAGNTLYNMSNFTSPRAVVDDDVLKVSITLTAADS